MNPNLFNSVIDLLEMFPDMEDEILDLFISFVLNEISSRDFELKAKAKCVNYVKNCILDIRQGVKKKSTLLLAYFDVARYQTDVTDAAIEWDCDENLLKLILKKRPPPETPEERLTLPTPIEVIKRREFF
jgi:hypothetical protein